MFHRRFRQNAHHPDSGTLTAANLAAALCAYGQSERSSSRLRDWNASDEIGRLPYGGSERSSSRLRDWNTHKEPAKKIASCVRTLIIPTEGLELRLLL